MCRPVKLMLFVERKRKWEGEGLSGIRSTHRVGMRKTQQRAERPLPRRGGNNASRECTVKATQHSALLLGPAAPAGRARRESNLGNETTLRRGKFNL